MNTKDKERESLWQKQLDETLNKIANREPFSYDVNGDKLYEQYKNHYQKQGQLAMENAIGQASALTGGYANSYAQLVGQQAYQDQMDNLNAIVPDLYQNAMDRYMAEEDYLYDRVAKLQGLLGIDSSTEGTKGDNSSTGVYSFIFDTLNEFETEAEAREYLMGLVGDTLTMPEAEYYYNLYKNKQTDDDQNDESGNYVVSKDIDTTAQSFSNEKQFGDWIDVSTENGVLTVPQAEALMDRYLPFYEVKEGTYGAVNKYSSSPVASQATIDSQILASPYYSGSKYLMDSYNDITKGVWLADSSNEKPEEESYSDYLKKQRKSYVGLK